MKNKPPFTNVSEALEQGFRDLFDSEAWANFRATVEIFHREMEEGIKSFKWPDK